MTVILLFCVLGGLWQQAQSQPPPSCSNGKIYDSCGSACPLSCANYAYRNRLVCPEICVGDCFCPEGLVEYNERCLDPRDCPANSSDPCSVASCGENYDCIISNVTGAAECFPNCQRNNGGCLESQLCIIEPLQFRPGYIKCVNPPYVPCGNNAFLACDSEFLYCLQQNITLRSACVASCLSDNGGCRTDQVCVTEVRGGNPRLECLEIGSLSSDCPAGQTLNPCGGCPQQTCEQYLRGDDTACITACLDPACECPQGLVLFRDRCVDPRLCHVLLNYPPAINPLPIVEDDEFLYSLFSPGSSAADFQESDFIEAVQGVLRREGFPGITVVLHGIYQNEGLQIVVVVSGDGVDQSSSVRVGQVLQDNSDQLPLTIKQVSAVNVDRISEYWTVGRIAGVTVGSFSALVLLILLVVGILLLVKYNSGKRGPLHTGKVDAFDTPSPYDQIHSDHYNTTGTTWWPRKDRERKKKDWNSNPNKLVFQ